MFNGVVAGGFNGMITVNWYNQRLQPCRLSVRTSGLAPSSCGDGTDIGNVLDRRYDFHVGTGDNGNVYQIVNGLDNGRTQNFTYDALNRITAAWTQGTTGNNCWGQMFGYMQSGIFVPGIDAWGNLNQITNTQCSTPTWSQPSTVQNQISGFCYDIAGNMLGQSGCPGLPYTPSNVYDAENRLITIHQTVTPYYTYDGDGKRAIKSYPGASRLYWTGTGSDTLTETDLSGNATADYVYFNGMAGRGLRLK
jgi:hypothetical protein